MRIQKRVSKDHEELPLPWPKSLLAISPGLLATVGLVNTDFSVWMLVGLILLVAFLVAVYGWNHRTFPGWSLMAVGMLTAIGLVIASGMIGGLASILVGMAANTFVLFTLLVIMITSLGFSKQIQHDPRLIWVLIALVIVCQLAVRIKYFVLLGLSWSVAGQWLDISLYAAVVALLLPVAFGLFLAKRHGRLTMLFVIGMIYANFQILIDVNFKVSDQIGGSIAFVAYKALIPLLFIVIAPLWFLRARPSFSRVGGLLTLVGLGIIFNFMVVGLSYGGELDLIIWMSFIPYALSVLITLALAYLLFREHEMRPVQVASDSAFTSD